MNTLLSTQYILSSYEIELHYKRPLFTSMKHISCSKDAEKILRDFINPNRLDLKEFFYVMLLTNANRLIGVSEVASGTTRCVIVPIKEILQLALKTNSSAILVAHTHPSGTLKKSKNDIRFTKKLKDGVKLMEITLLDHLIITSEAYISFSDDRQL